MKSRLIIAALSLVAISASAQLTVTEDGNVIMADETTANVNLHVGDNTYINILGKIGARSTVNTRKKDTGGKLQRKET